MFLLTQPLLSRFSFAGIIFHQTANEIMAELSGKDTKLFVPEMILIELANALSSVELRTRAVILIDELQTLPNVEIIWSSTELFRKSVDSLQRKTRQRMEFDRLHEFRRDERTLNQSSLHLRQTF